MESTTLSARQSKVVVLAIIGVMLLATVAMFAVAISVHDVASATNALHHSAAAIDNSWHSEAITYTSPTTVFPTDVNQDNVLSIFGLVISNSAVLLLILLGFAVGVFGLVLRAIRRARSA